LVIAPSIEGIALQLGVHIEGVGWRFLAELNRDARSEVSHDAEAIERSRRVVGLDAYRTNANEPEGHRSCMLPPGALGSLLRHGEAGIAHFPPLFMIGLAYGVSALILLRQTLRTKTAWWAMFAIAAFGGAIQSGLIFAGLNRLPASTAILVVQSQVPFAVLCAWVICGERPDLRRLLGVAVVLLGIVLIAGAPDAVSALDALALVLLGTLSWGISQALVRALGRDDGPTTIGAMTLYAAPQLLVASLFLETGQLESLRTATVDVWVAVLVLAIGGYVVAYSIWYGLMKRYRVDQVTPFALLMPLVGVLAGAIFLGEHLSLWIALGGIVVLGGLAVTLKEPPRA
jgi:O-acetylserine/cysteine efflux transporter